jgi:hypothetical protein
MATKIWVGGDSGNENDWNTAANWSPSGVPAANDDVVVPAAAANDIDGYDASAVSLSSFRVEVGCTIAIGSAATDLQLDVGGTGDSTVYLAGTGTMYLDIDNAARIDVAKAGSGAAAGSYNLHLVGLDNDAIYVAPSGSASRISLAAGSGETLESDDVVITNGIVEIGSGVTKKDGASAIPLRMSGGTVEANCPLGTVNKTGGSLTCEDGAVAAINEDGGTTYYKSGGTLTTLRVGEGGTFDASGCLGGATITNAYLYEAASLKDPLRKLTLTNGVELVRTTIDDVTLDLGTHIKLTVAAAS